MKSSTSQLPTIDVKVFILKTSIQNTYDLERVSGYFDHHEAIIRWSVDLLDWERVLKVVAAESLQLDDIIVYLESCGFSCSEIED